MTYKYKDMELISLLLFIIIFYGSPGPATISLGACGLSHSFKTSLPYIAGILLGLFINISIGTNGLSIAFESYPDVLIVLKFLGVLYILYLAWKIFKTKISWDNNVKLKFRDGLLLNLLNPKAYVGAILVSDQFLMHSTISFNAWTIIALVMLVGLVVDIFWFFTGFKAKNYLSIKGLKVVNSILAVVLAITGIYGIL